MLENNVDLVRKIVWKYVRTNEGLEFDDLFSEACIACLEAAPSYNPVKGKQSTFIYHVINNHLKTTVGYEAHHAAKNITSDKIYMEEFGTSPEEYFIAQENWEGILRNLSPKAREVCDMVFNEPEVYIPTDKPKKSRGIIIKELKARGWAWSDIWNSFREIKLTLTAHP